MDLAHIIRTLLCSVVTSAAAIALGYFVETSLIDQKPFEWKIEQTMERILLFA